MNETANFPSAAQIAKGKQDFKATVASIAREMQLRVRAIELAAQFPAADPMKLAREIFAFLTERESE